MPEPFVKQQSQPPTDSPGGKAQPSDTLLLSYLQRYSSIVASSSGVTSKTNPPRMHGTK